MTILRWLLSHLLIFIFLASLSLAYVFRADLKNDYDRLTGNDLSLEISDKQAVDSLSTKENNSGSKQADTSSANIEKNKPSVSPRHELNKPIQQPPNQAETKLETGRQKNDAVANTPDVSVSKTNDPWGQSATSNIKTNKPVDVVEVKGVSSSVSNFPPDDYIPEGKVSNSGAPINTDNNTQLTSASSASQLNEPLTSQTDNPVNEGAAAKTSAYISALANVRQLFWSGETGPAQENYEKLMFDYPDQPEAAAELGNIFLQQGNRKAASWAYQNAIPRYLDLHREQEAINLIHFISQHDPAIAESLQKKYW